MTQRMLITVAFLVSAALASDTTEYCCPDAKKCLTPSNTQCNPSEANACSDAAFPICCPVTKLCVKAGADCVAPPVCKATEYCCPDAKHCLTASNLTCSSDKACVGDSPVCCPLTKLCVKVGAACDSPCGEKPSATSLIPGGKDLNPVCYECPTEEYAEKVMKGDPLVHLHTKISGSCASQGFDKYIANDPVFKDAKLFRKGSGGLGQAIIGFTFKNCNEKAHVQVTSLNVKEAAPKAGDNITLTLIATNDKVIKEMKSFLRFEKSLIHHKYDGCAGATIKGPDAEPTITIGTPFDGGCPFSQNPIAELTHYVKTSKFALPLSTFHIESRDQDDAPVICLDVTMKREAEALV